MQTFTITYRVKVSDGESVDQKIESICLEQSVELPLQVLSETFEQKVVGKPAEKKQLAEDTYEVTIRWPVENIGAEISNFLNILYGNISLQPGIKVIDSEWPLLNGPLFGGPAFGIGKLRDRYAIQSRALSATALKPVGSNAEELADLAYRFARGGIDIIKDDHGLANQEYAPFGKRVEACMRAISKAADETGVRSYYFPHITALARDTIKRYETAAELGADGVLLCPHIAGMETMHQLARTDIDLPIIAHPAFSGGLTTNADHGLTPAYLYGKLWRALGADFVIYPNVGGRFSLTREQCEAINREARQPDSPFLRSFPMPAGGMKRETIGRWIETYGPDTVFLVGGSLYEHPDGIEQASEEFSRTIRETAQ
ncbi:MAG: RuBisCO large subunit C-terminal-like domain-containing protein [Balneolaceae bacterium]|nr:RuBisCO large subunit C-terminal-like domain-containing protein [Balneolaceae bacterium]